MFASSLSNVIDFGNEKKGYWLYIKHDDGSETFAGWFHYRRDAIKNGKRITDGWNKSYRTVKASE